MVGVRGAGVGAGAGAGADGSGGAVGGRSCGFGVGFGVTWRMADHSVAAREWICSWRQQLES